jgi:crotonobetainyl-CoA:carnitine CoA-transferase CaiB-like acyl-CoA transferase
MLADAGARVIKIEDPERGDETRRWGPPFVGDVAAYFLAVNRAKESIAIDLKSDRGREIAQRIVDRADVVLDNFLDSQRALMPVAPKNAVRCTIRGFDRDTPEAAAPGYDLLAQAESGLMAITGVPDGDPMKAGVALADVLTAHYAYGAITSALFARERTGEGAAIEVSLFSSTLASLVNVAQSALVTGREAVRYGNAHPSIVPYQMFHASDRAFAIGAGTDRHYQLLCTRVIDRADLAADAGFASNAARVTNRELLLPQLERVFATKRAAHWVARCRKVSIPAALVRGVREALRTPAARGVVKGDAMRNPVVINGKRREIGSPAPRLGQHTIEILRELGYSKKEIAEITGPATDGKARGSRSSRTRSRRR